MSLPLPFRPTNSVAPPDAGWNAVSHTAPDRDATLNQTVAVSSVWPANVRQTCDGLPVELARPAHAPACTVVP
ncbi:MAG: hypothetical protein WEE66_12330 [Actinomycetota bacterium]